MRRRGTGRDGTYKRTGSIDYFDGQTASIEYDGTDGHCGPGEDGVIITRDELRKYKKKE